MKALILAAGLGTRLLPYTRQIPKPLFTLNNIPMLDRCIRCLEEIGSSHILINTHHLHGQIREYIDARYGETTLTLIHEPEILETGGAIANAERYLSEAPFFVINADIIFSLDLNAVYQDHLKTGALATLVVHDCKPFNKLRVGSDGLVKGFDAGTDGYAFTGVQVLSPEIFNYFPDKKYFSSIEVYDGLSALNQVRARIETDLFWSDIGTPSDYSLASTRVQTAEAFGLSLNRIPEIKVSPLCGDGSDRKWYRALHGSRSVIVGDHGICKPGSDRHKELLAFIKIGNHLKQTGLNVPVIYGYDLLSGIVTLEDLGDVHLQSVVNQTQDETLTLALYKNVIDHLIDFSENAKTGFNPDWACQTPAYSKDVIIEKECRYFIQAFVECYLNRPVDANALTDEFEWLADRVLESGRPGLMHRDCQSRNIMIKDNQPYFIDFQSARLGPVQYDLASLLIDPYVNLNSGIQRQLLEYAMERLASDKENEKNFLKGYRYCCITRNLQILGAFGFLTVQKNKTGFERYIPVALKRLKQNLKTAPDGLHKLSDLVQAL